jgi:hypothetical protein
MDLIVVSARETIPGAEAVGITLSEAGVGIRTIAATDQLVLDVDDAQYSLGEGPCLDAMNGTGVEIVPDLAAEQRWPRFIPAALERGVHSQMGMELFYDRVTRGALNIYSSRVGAFDDRSLVIASLFADHAAVALGRTKKEDQLNAALLTRRVIGQAVGIIMERYRMDEEEGFAFLTQVSQTGNVKLRTVAMELVDTTNKRAGKPPAHPGDGGDRVSVPVRLPGRG